MTTEELVKALLDDAHTQRMAECPGWANRSEKAAATIERQAEAIRVLREALDDCADRMEDRVGLRSGADRARGILAQTKEFGE